MTNTTKFASEIPAHFGNALYGAYLNDSPETAQALAILQAAHRMVEASERGRVYRIAYYVRAAA